MWQSPITTLNAGMSERGTELKPIRKHVASLRPHSHSPSIGFELRLDFAHAALDQSQQSELNHFNASVQLNPRAEVQVRSIYIHLIQLIHAFQKVTVFGSCSACLRAAHSSAATQAGLQAG